jgi:hypothetical protein
VRAVPLMLVSIPVLVVRLNRGRLRYRGGNPVGVSAGAVMPPVAEHRTGWHQAACPWMTAGTDVDLVGYEVEAIEGGIGKIDEASCDVGPTPARQVLA